MIPGHANLMSSKSTLPAPLVARAGDGPYREPCLCRLECSGAGSSWQQVYAGSNTSHKVTNLAPGHSYDFRVAAGNAVGCSSWSSVASVCTHLQPPLPPATVSAQLQTTSTDRHASLARPSKLTSILLCAALVECFHG